MREAAGAPICMTSSFQTEDMVVLHMLRQHLPDVPVIFLETGYHFKELLAYRDRMTAEWKLNLVNALPKTTLKEHEAEVSACCTSCSRHSAARSARSSR